MLLGRETVDINAHLLQGHHSRGDRGVSLQVGVWVVRLPIVSLEVFPRQSSSSILMLTRKPKSVLR
jgi:hypothetical protein